MESREGRTLEVQIYLALAPGDVALAPFDWYRDHCLAGAREHALPEHVVDEIRGWTVVASRTD